MLLNIVLELQFLNLIFLIYSPIAELPLHLLSHLLFCSLHFFEPQLLTLIPFIYPVKFRSLKFVENVPFKNILSITTPQFYTMGSIWSSMSLEILSLFSSKSWKMKLATVFLMIPPLTLMTAWDREFIRKCARWGWSIW